ncbi:MMPL family transporter [Streptomyces ipomoeae]|uniref:MMPL family transporter n=1 Tax=Streptomyces ipomoeae TaxID=103232 RepID=UPI001146AF3F|nr:MMPL family transporter [Streptomyces ipomoeae]MDX2937040.1 MMPL family transporter [Streptomyces ipomoeae]TQE18459.1 MMPL family transporter [Streptomyces ipomoeae]
MDAIRRRAWWVVVCAAPAAVCAAVLAPLALESLGTGGAVATGIEAERARRQAERLGVPSPDLILSLSPGADGPAPPAPSRTDEQATADQASLRTGTEAVVEALSDEPDVRAVWSARTAEDDWLRSRDGRTVLVEARLKGSEKDRADAAPQVVEAARSAARSAAPGLRVEPSGEVWTSREIEETVDRDLRLAELVAAPVLFGMLVFAYGSVVSALLPVLVAALAVGCTLPVLALLAQAVDVSRMGANAVSAIGFGLAVDYSLFLLARVREHTARGEELEEALKAALRSSGRSIAFSAAAVTACLAAAMVVPVPLLRSLCLAGMVVTLLAALVALVVLPACLVLLGPRAQAWDPLARWRRTRLGDGSRFWRDTARAVTARPFLAGGLAALLLLLLALPFTHVRLGLVDDRTLPVSTAVATTAERLRTDFAAPPERLLTVVVTGPRATDGVGSYRDRLARVPDVTAVRVAGTDRDRAAVLLVASAVGPDTRQAADLVRAVREAPAPGSVRVGGRAAEVTDSSAAVRDALPWCMLLSALALTVLLGVFTRTVVAPLKAMVVAVLSLGATLGALVVLFQDGHGSPLGGFTVTGTLDTSALLFTLVITLALSVDYEVFLLGRIREEYDRGGDNRTAIVDGIARTGRLMTSAAAAVAISTAAMGASHVTLIKVLGIGVAVGALVDAALVRGVLVPAVMAALGPANWWNPAASRTRPAASATD